MSDDDRKGFWASLLDLARDTDHPAGMLVVMVFVVGFVVLMMAFPMVLATVMTTGMGIMSGKTPVQSIWRNCYDLKEISGKIYKVDQCSGKIERYNPDDDED
jgi:hypothetical protein